MASGPPPPPGKRLGGNDIPTLDSAESIAGRLRDLGAYVDEEVRRIADAVEKLGRAK